MTLVQTREFMDRMDVLWKEHFDFALDQIPETDREALYQHYLLLDDFFVCYWHLLDGLAADIPSAELIRLLANKYDKALQKSEDVWRNTAGAQIRRAQKLRRKKARLADRFLSTYQTADTLLKEARMIDNIEKRIANRKQASGLLEEYIKQLLAAR